MLFALYHLHEPWVIPTTLIDIFALAYPSRRFQSAWMGIIVHATRSPRRNDRGYRSNVASPGAMSERDNLPSPRAGGGASAGGSVSFKIPTLGAGCRRARSEPLAEPPCRTFGGTALDDADGFVTEPLVETCDQRS